MRAAAFTGRYPSRSCDGDCGRVPHPGILPQRNKVAALAGDLLPAKKPDADNVAKIITDALNGLAYIDMRRLLICL